LFLSLACSSDLPHPRYTGQPTSALTEVPYPPPPARVEMVARRPVDDAVYVRGEWAWDGRRWAWKQGSWYVPPDGALYARWATVRGRDGKLYFAPGGWRSADGKERPAPPPVRGAASGTESVVNPEGENESVGPTIPADGGVPEGGGIEQDRGGSQRPGPR